jgi:hypothetical protein
LPGGKKMNGTSSDKAPNGLARLTSNLRRIINSKPIKLVNITLAFIIAGFICLIMILQYPESRRLQDQVIGELRSLPVPPGTTERYFSSGFQSGKGRAVREIFSNTSERNLCTFYRPIMANLGWRLVEENCYPSSYHHLLMEYRKGQMSWRVTTDGQYDMSMEHTYDLASTWTIDLPFWNGKGPHN